MRRNFCIARHVSVVMSHVQILRSLSRKLVWGRVSFVCTMTHIRVSPRYRILFRYHRHLNGASASFYYHLHLLRYTLHRGGD